MNDLLKVIGMWVAAFVFPAITYAATYPFVVQWYFSDKPYVFPLGMGVMLIATVLYSVHIFGKMGGGMGGPFGKDGFDRWFEKKEK